MQALCRRIRGDKQKTGHASLLLSPPPTCVAYARQEIVSHVTKFSQKGPYPYPYHPTFLITQKCWSKRRYSSRMELVFHLFKCIYNIVKKLIIGTFIRWQQQTLQFARCMISSICFSFCFFDTKFKAQKDKGGARKHSSLFVLEPQHHKEGPQYRLVSKTAHFHQEKTFVLF